MKIVVITMFPLCNAWENAMACDPGNQRLKGEKEPLSGDPLEQRPKRHPGLGKRDHVNQHAPPVQGTVVDEKLTVKRLATVLHEREYRALARVLKVLGEERCVELLAEALTVEHEGGMRRKDDRRRKRTLGGVFLALCREQASAEERRQMFG